MGSRIAAVFVAFFLIFLSGAAWAAHDHAAPVPSVAAVSVQDAGDPSEGWSAAEVDSEGSMDLPDLVQPRADGAGPVVGERHPGGAVDHHQADGGERQDGAQQRPVDVMLKAALVEHRTQCLSCRRAARRDAPAPPRARPGSAPRWR
jgi:hypothetical protein